MVTIVGLLDDKEMAKELTFIAKLHVIGQRAQWLSKDLKKKQAKAASGAKNESDT